MRSKVKGGIGMSDIEKAIKQLKRYNGCNSFEIEPENVKLTISALQEKAEREKGCDICKGALPCDNGCDGFCDIGNRRS